MQWRKEQSSCVGQPDARTWHVPNDVVLLRLLPCGKLQDALGTRKKEKMLTMRERRCAARVKPGRRFHTSAHLGRRQKLGASGVGARGQLTLVGIYRVVGLCHEEHAGGGGKGLFHECASRGNKGGPALVLSKRTGPQGPWSTRPACGCTPCSGQPP
jgi:hypothetical protein